MIFEKKEYAREENSQFVVDEEQVIVGLDKAMETMKAGEALIRPSGAKVGIARVGGVMPQHQKATQAS